MTKELYKIALCFDKNYLVHANTLISSILSSNKKNKKRFFFYLFLLGDSNKIVIKLPQDQYQIIYMNENIFDGFKDCLYLGKAAYMRLHIPNILKKEEKILYLDSDIIVNGDITKIRSFCLEDKYFAVCSENNINMFNTGVMLINIQPRRRDNLTNILIDFIKEHPDKILVADQSALNICIPKEKVFFLPPIYNQTIQFRLAPIGNEYKKLGTLISIRFNSVVIHFNGKQKPWNFGCEHPLGFLYYKYISSITHKMAITMFYNIFYSIIKMFLYYIIKLFSHIYNKIQTLLNKFYIK